MLYDGRRTSGWGDVLAIASRHATADNAVHQSLKGQLADTPTRGLPTRGLDNSRTGQVADWTTGETVRELTSARVV